MANSIRLAAYVTAASFVLLIMRDPMKKVTATDLRTIRTKKAIHTAFQEMAAQMDIKNITVKELSERAGINRKTFYSHYDSIEALSKELLDDLIQNLQQIILSDRPHEFRDTLANIYRFMCSLPVWYRNLLCIKDSPMEQHIIARFADCQLSQHADLSDPIILDQYMKLRYIAASSIELFRLWNDANGSIPMEKFIDRATGLICFGERYL